MAEDPELSVLMKTDRMFEPPAGYAAAAEFNDGSVYEEADADY